MIFSRRTRLSAFFLLAAATFACGRDPTLPGYEIALLSDMTRAVPAESFAKNAVMKDGMTLQAPPEGTVPRGFEPFDYGSGDAEGARAGEELKNPFPASPENLERGKFVYENFCSACHGSTGEGDGQLIPRYPNPPAFPDKRLLALPDGRLFHSITRGKRDMPSHASQLEAADRWKVILHIRELQKQAQTAAPAGPTTGGNP